MEEKAKQQQSRLLTYYQSLKDELGNRQAWIYLNRVADTLQRMALGERFDTMDPKRVKPQNRARFMKAVALYNHQFNDIQISKDGKKLIKLTYAEWEESKLDPLQMDRRRQSPGQE